MIKTEAIKAKAGQELIAYEPVSPKFLFIILLPVAANADDLLRVVVNRYNVRKANFVFVAVLIFKIFVNMHLKKRHDFIRLIAT